MKKEVIQKEKKEVKPTKRIEKQRWAARNFFKDTQLELKRVTWPDRQTVSRSALFILIIFVFSAIFVSGLDIVFSKLLILVKEYW